LAAQSEEDPRIQKLNRVAIRSKHSTNMWVTASRSAVLSITTGGGKWVEMTISADPLYQHLLLTAEKKFWRCAETAL